MAKRRKKQPKQVKTIKHDGAKRTHIPTAEYEPMMRDDEQTPMTATYTRRNHDLDSQLM